MATIFIGMGKPTFPIPYHFLELGREFARRGHEVHLIMHHHHPIEEKGGNPAIHYWPWHSGILRILQDLLLLIPLVRRYHPSCIIVGHRDTTVLNLAGWLCKVPIRVWYHHTLTQQIDLISTRPLFIRRFRRLLRIPIYNLITTHFIGVSNAAKSDLERVMKTAPERTFVLYNTLSDPLDPNCLSPKLNGLPEERIVCVGRLDISKGQDILIHAVNILKDKFPNIRVHFIGTGKDAQRFQLLAEELGVSTNCHFIGVVPHHEVLSWMYSASLTVVPSRMDNLPTTAIESMAVGTPVIGTAVGGIPEVLGGGGILVPPEDPASLAESIASLLRDEQLRKLWSNKARTRFLEVFERSRVIPKHADFYEELLAAYGQV